MDWALDPSRSSSRTRRGVAVMTLAEAAVSTREHLHITTPDLWTTGAALRLTPHAIHDVLRVTCLACEVN